MIKTRIFQFVGHIHNMLLCIEMISFINHEHESPLRWFYSFVNPGILAFVLGAWSGCIQAGWGSDLWLSAVVLWNSASHVSTMLRSNLDLSDIRPWYSTTTTQHWNTHTHTHTQTQTQTHTHTHTYTPNTHTTHRTHGNHLEIFSCLL